MSQANESAVRDLLERWAAAVRAKNMSEVLANHSPDLEVVAGEDVAFAFAHMQCVEPTEKVQRTPLDFRLTVGLQKLEGRWIIVHEHHSVPAT
jgi:ketosteroid isomerase-like protein